MLEPGALLQGRYRVVRLLSKGGMGAVYEAVDERLNSTVALKETFFSQAPLRRQFEREAHILARLRHPAMTKVIDHFGENEGQFLVMEFIPGTDLHAQLKDREQPFAIGDVITWGEQLLDALDYLHNQNPPIVHRDIKPQNLKLAERNQIILLDFGLAKDSLLPLTDGSTSASLFGYTPHYAPLEQIEGKGTDARSDLFSLAATLYELLTGAPPVDSLTRASALARGEADPLMSASEKRWEVPRGVSALLATAMALDRNRRPASAHDMRDALRSASLNTMSAAPTLSNTVAATTLTEAPTVLVSEGAAPRLETTVPPPPRPRSRGRRALIALAVLLVAVAIAVALLRRSDAPVAAPATPSGAAAQPPASTIDVTSRRPPGAVSGKLLETSIADAKSTPPPASTTLPAGDKDLSSVAVSADGRLIAAGGHDSRVYLWDRASGTQLASIPTPGEIYHVTISPDSRSVAAMISYSAADSASIVVLIDIASRSITQKIIGKYGLVMTGAWDPADGHGLAFADGTQLRLWNLAEAREVRALGAHENGITEVAYSPDGAQVVTGSHDGKVLVWNAATGERITEFQEKNGIRAVAFSPDGSALAWGHYYDFLHVGSPTAGTRTARITLPAMVNALAFSPDGDLLAVAANVSGRTLILRTSDYVVAHNWDDTSVGTASLTFTPDSRSLVATSGNGVKVWAIGN